VAGLIKHFSHTPGSSLDAPVGQSLPVRERKFKGIFTAHKNPFLLFEHYCEDPVCDCDTVILTFVETSPDGLPIPRAMEFDICLSCKDWQATLLSEAGEHAEKINAILKEFSGDLTPQIKAVFDQRSHEVKSFMKKALEFDLSDEEILSGAMRGYWEVFGKPGDYFSFEFEYENQKYLIVDQYCLNAECDCQTISLAFAAVDEKSNAAEDAFAIFIELNMHYKIEFSKYPKKKAREIADAWLRSVPNLQEDIAYRYLKMKEVGRLTLERNRQMRLAGKTSASVNIGRNDPCPCGSGKKYKKCCGKD
jgi:hypothetical protein